MNTYKILLVDDEVSIRETFKIILEDYGYEVVTAKDGFEAIYLLKNNLIDILITDLRMPKMDGIELMKRSLEIDSTIEVIFISAYADIRCAVKAIKMGAFDYVQKSFSTEELLITVEKAVERKKLVEENIHLKNQMKGKYDQDGVIGKSEKMQKLFFMVNRIANSRATVILTGESGVGKEVIANLIHTRSVRRDKPFVAINCGAIPENLIESELFGHEKGAFTGAIQQKIGKFEQAHGGTIFLDEVSELPLSMQVKFLRVLQERQIQKIGSNHNININIRVIAATNKDLKGQVDLGEFRKDLYYRLNVVNIRIPSLGERKEDIPLLAERFLSMFAEEYQKNLKFIDIHTLRLLMEYRWKGNVRELKNAIEHSVVIADDDEEILSNKHLPIEVLGEDISEENNSEEIMTLKEHEKLIIDNTLKRLDGNKTKTSEVLGIKRQTLYNKIKEYNLDA